MGFFAALIETISENMEAYNADMQEMAKAKETYNRLAKKYGKPIIKEPTVTVSSSNTATKKEAHRVPEPVSFDGYLDAHNFLKAGGYVYQSIDVWKKGSVVARGRRVSSNNSYVVTFHEL